MPSDVMTAVLFPGQGSQEKGMGRDLAEADAECLDLWKAAEQASGLELRGIFWEGEDKDMADTRALQPALTAVNLGFWTLAARRGLSPAFLAGHSLGEYAALAASGVLGIKDVLTLVSLRGRLMAEAAGPGGSGAGGMAAILKLSEAQVAEIVEAAKAETSQELRIANYNTPQQHVVSGTCAAVEAAGRLVKERKGRAVVLPVSGAFHSPLMAEAAAEFTKVLAKTDFTAPGTPVVCNVTAQAEVDPASIRGLMARQMTESVRWTQSVQQMHAAGVRRFVELGPKGVLTRMVAPILDGCGEAPEALSVASLDAVQSIN